MKRGPKIKFKVVPGNRYGRLTIIREIEPRAFGKITIRRVECKCDCGNISSHSWRGVYSGTSSSCGCYGLESRRRSAGGYVGTPEYRTWNAMKQRCLNPNNKSYKYYGGKGITICDRWLHSFENFLEDMGARPADLSIDRIDSDGNYEPSNCRWATLTVQAINRRVFFESMGKSYAPFQSISDIVFPA